MISDFLRLMFTRGITMVRWNNFPRIVDVTHMDNIGFTLHVALYLAFLEESKFGNKVDKLFLMKKIIFSSFKDLILSDINSETKNYIKKIDKEIFEKVDKRAIDFLLGFEGPNYLREDFKKVILDNSESLENSIILSAKKYAGYEEAKANSKVFSFMYEVALKDLKSFLDKKSKNLKSLNFLMIDEKTQKYLSHIQRLSFSMRWNQLKRTYPISVMSHQVIVSFLSYIIGTLENHCGEKYDIEKLMSKAIYHDVPEVITGDIISPTKKIVEGFEEVLEKVEYKMVEDYLFCYVDEDYKKDIGEYILSPFSGKHGKIVKQADIISAFLEAKIEDDHGNYVFEESHRRLLEKVYSYKSVSVDYIIKCIILGFGQKKEYVIPEEK